ALPTLRAATDPGALGGQYYGPGGRNEVKGHPRLVTSSPESYEVAVQQRLWAVSEDLTGVKFPVVQSQQNSFSSGAAIPM
ncbi:short-chain dehydrogenase, partial [Streptomyces sp. NRRL WC-3753]